MGLEQLISIRDKCIEAGKPDEAVAAFQFAALSLDAGGVDGTPA